MATSVTLYHAIVAFPSLLDRKVPCNQHWNFPFNALLFRSSYRDGALGVLPPAPISAGEAGVGHRGAERGAAPPEDGGGRGSAGTDEIRCCILYLMSRVHIQVAKFSEILYTSMLHPTQGKQIIRNN